MKLEMASVKVIGERTETKRKGLVSSQCSIKIKTAKETDLKIHEGGILCRQTDAKDIDVSLFVTLSATIHSHLALHQTETLGKGGEKEGGE